MIHSKESIDLIEKRIEKIRGAIARDEDDVSRRPALKDYYLPVIKLNKNTIEELKIIVDIMEIQNNTDRAING